MTSKPIGFSELLPRANSQMAARSMLLNEPVEQKASLTLPVVEKTLTDAVRPPLGLENGPSVKVSVFPPFVIFSVRGEPPSSKVHVSFLPFSGCTGQPAGERMVERTVLPSGSMVKTRNVRMRAGPHGLRSSPQERLEASKRIS